MPLLSVAKPALINFFQSEIDAIGLQVNDPNLFDDVRKACLSEWAFLFMGVDGFAVLKPVIRNDAKGVLIWVAYSPGKCDRSACVEFFEEKAREIGGTFVEIWSARRGYFRVLPKLGYSPSPNCWCGTPVTVWTKPL